MTHQRIERVQVAVTGAVQGVGFRPFVYRLATDLNLQGWVNNSSQGVVIEVEAVKPHLDEFLTRLEREKPPHALISSIRSKFLAPIGYDGFEIRHSDASGSKTALILPDLAICPDCLRDILDPANRRYRYPFTNCTNCGPRFTIIEALPYDRPNTTMKHFPMCDECKAEYDNPLDRRFHAQPNACPHCGPHLELWKQDGRVLESHDNALLAAAEALRQGAIVAVKGLGGFHLMVDARNGDAVARLRQRKGREEKPFALMYPSLEQVTADCKVSELEAELLRSASAPIVLLRHANPAIAREVAPGNPTLGVMLPYTPLHHLLMEELGFPVVATSGNLSGETICTDEQDALVRLGNIADIFLVHNRPIARHADDSIVCVAAGREMVLRRARGYAPLPVEIEPAARPMIAVGAHVKNAAAVAKGHSVFLSQYIGDMDTEQTVATFKQTLADFERLYDLKPEAIASDLHPDYKSTHYAQETGLPIIPVQHHYAHVLACMAENHLQAPVFGVSWDGTGYGTDGTVWGGEFLTINEHSYKRVAQLRGFRLPGGDTAVKEPRRSALGLLYEIYGDALFEIDDLPTVRAFTKAERGILKTILARGLNAPMTSSAGRLFDAVASLIGIRQRCSFEGQAAMELEFALDGLKTDECYTFEITDVTGVDTPVRCIMDWTPMILRILSDMRSGMATATIAARFHNTLSEMIVAAARTANIEQVVLTGGCFQNRYLIEQTIQRLKNAGFQPYWHRVVPPNDGGIALGQVMAALREESKEQ